MKLIDFQIKNYKVIDDTRSIKVDPCVTALVGKNESGKTAVLKALWKTHNVADATFDKLYDYPRDRYAKERKGTQQVTVLTFELSPEEADGLVASASQPPATKPKHVTYTTLYKGEDEAAKDIQFDGLEVDGNGATASAAVDAASKALLSQSTEDVEPLRTALRAAHEEIDKEAPLWESATISALDTINDAIANWIDADTSRNDVAIDEREQLRAVLTHAKQGNPVDRARTWFEERLPTFIYFDDYGQLETKIHLPMYLERKAAPDPRTRTQTALFEWSGIDAEEILNLGRPRDGGETEEEVYRRHEKRRALLDSASFTLTGDWIRWWTEKRHRLHFDVDGQDLGCCRKLPCRVQGVSSSKKGTGPCGSRQIYIDHCP